MDSVDDHLPPAGLFTGGNAQILIGDTSRRFPEVTRSGDDISRGPQRETGEPTHRPHDNAGTSDPVSLGFQKILARFDDFEFRLGKLETKQSPDPDPLFSDDAEVADEDFPWTFNHGRRDRGGDIRHRQGAIRDSLIRGNRTLQFDQGTAPYRARPETRQRSNWDRPPDRNPRDLARGFREYRQTTAWDPPVARHDYAATRTDRPKDLTMKAPRFDGSDATNWIARVEYYFDHLRMPDSERLHYVVMLFQPPAAEWIFNYRENNPMVTWLEFLEDVCHRFDPQSFRNSIGPLSKLVQTGSVTEYHDAFERYLNRVKGLSDEALIPIFITGLKEPIQEKVELQQPDSLAEAMALALRLGASH